jgi:hypothetical protein
MVEREYASTDDEADGKWHANGGEAPDADDDANGDLDAEGELVDSSEEEELEVQAAAFSNSYPLSPSQESSPDSPPTQEQHRDDHPRETASENYSAIPNMTTTSHIHPKTHPNPTTTPRRRGRPKLLKLTKTQQKQKQKQKQKQTQTQTRCHPRILPIVLADQQMLQQQQQQQPIHQQADQPAGYQPISPTTRPKLGVIGGQRAPREGWCSFCSREGGFDDLNGNITRGEVPISLITPSNHQSTHQNSLHSSRDPLAPPGSTSASRRRGKGEMVSCWECGQSGKSLSIEKKKTYISTWLAHSPNYVPTGHFSCMELNNLTIKSHVKSYPWLCLECRRCHGCDKKGIALLS